MDIISSKVDVTTSIQVTYAVFSLVKVMQNVNSFKILQINKVHFQKFVGPGFSTLIFLTLQCVIETDSPVRAIRYLMPYMRYF